MCSKIDIELLSTYIAQASSSSTGDAAKKTRSASSSDPVEVETAARSGTVRIEPGIKYIRVPVMLTGCTARY